MTMGTWWSMSGPTKGEGSSRATRHSFGLTVFDAFEVRGVNDVSHHFKILVVLFPGNGVDVVGGASEETWPPVYELEVLLAAYICEGPIVDGGWTEGCNLSDGGDSEVVQKTTISYFPL